MPQLGFLSGNSASTISARVGAFRQGLREVGYAEGKNIAIEYRYADGKLDRLNDLAAELVTRKVSVIVTHGDSAIGALNRATKTIPLYQDFGVSFPCLKRIVIYPWTICPLFLEAQFRLMPFWQKRNQPKDKT